MTDSYDRERNGLAQRKMYRTIAPWITENPIFFHLRYADDESVKNAVDQCAATGFEKIILSFGSGFDIEDSTRANLDCFKSLTLYAHSKGIALGGYSLLASRHIGGGHDVVWYFLNGSSKTGMGYRESNWSLPRRQQEIIERQNIFDGTWEKTPSMGWMHVPLVEYQGGGSEATIEPLKEHLPHYGQRLADLFGAGVQAAWRGTRLYDAPETMELVKKWVSFYKKHRAILDADIIHIRRADGRDIDAILHVNPQNEEKGLLMVYNPLNHPVQKELNVNIYYTGLKKVASVSENDNSPQNYKIGRDYTVAIKINVEANSQSWYIIK